MNLEKRTKKELLEIIDLKDGRIDSLSNKLSESEDLSGRFRDKINELQRKLDELKKEGVLKGIDGIAEIKSVQMLLSIYTTETMTHREKAYLGEKINHVIDNMVDRKNEEVLSLKRDGDVGGGLPF